MPLNALSSKRLFEPLCQWRAKFTEQPLTFGLGSCVAQDRSISTSPLLTALKTNVIISKVRWTQFQERHLCLKLQLLLKITRRNYRLREAPEVPPPLCSCRHFSFSRVSVHEMAQKQLNMP